MGDTENPHTCLSDDSIHRIRHVESHYFGCLRDSERDEFLLYANDEERKIIHKAEVKIRNRIKRISHHEDAARLIVEIKELRKDFIRRCTPNGSPKCPGQEASSTSSRQQLATEQRSHTYEMHASMLCFDPESPQKAMDRKKISVHDLSKDNNPIREPCPEGKFRYFHLPHNNMKWVVETIAAYYNEPLPEYNGIQQRNVKKGKMTRTELLLRPQFWLGQQHGEHDDPVHARYMRPHCESICTHTNWLEKQNEDNDNNLVLFMPYLHWEEDRQRALFSEVIRKRTEEEKLEEEKLEMEKRHKNKLRMELNKERKASGQPPLHGPDIELPSDKMKALNEEKQTLARRIPKLNTLFDVVISAAEEPKLAVKRKVFSNKELERPVNVGIFFKRDTTRAVTETTCLPNTKPNTKLVLGQLLLRAAELFEKISWHDAEEMIQENLYETPPLHPRRTLDQAYYWTLNSTDTRDRNQVVYRATTPQQKFMHHPLCHLKAKTQDEDEQSQNQCRHHVHCWETVGCGKCKDDIRNRSCVVMVDQLWLWILDGNTIITAFPRRWPRHKHDYTGVQQSIKIRLRNSPKGEIRTVYDLALLIINQASKVFHDRTITADRQPPVMDHFANAIGNLNNKQTIAYDHLWNCARALANMKRNKNDRRAAALEKYMLDINSEGELLKEIDEIKDELRMMIFFKERQQHVLEEFEVHVGNILHQSLERLNREQRHLRALAKKAKEAKFDSELVEKKDLKDKSDISPGVKSKGKKKIVWTITPEKEAWTKSMIKDRTKSLQGQHAELSGLYRSAEQTEQAIQHLLQLKQQQAGLIDSRGALEQSRETVRQGVTLMAFTIITVLFLPLSFVASIFGMNAIDRPGGFTTLSRQMEIMFPTSLLVTFAAAILAFNKSTRAVLYCASSYSFTWFVTKVSLYPWWKGLDPDSQPLDEEIDKKISKMKEDSLKRARKAKKDAYFNIKKGASANVQENERLFQASMQNGEIV